MNDSEKLRDIIRNDLDVRANDETHDRMRDIVLDAHGHSQDIGSAKTLIWTRSILMKHPITKLAVAAAIVAAVLIGLSLFSNSGSGIVWAEVAQKVQASRGVIYRAVKHAPDPYGRGVDFSVDHYSSTRARLDRYKGGEIVGTMYDNCETKTVILVDHTHKSYVQDTNAEDMPDSFQVADPNSVIQRFLSCEHKELGRKTIDGVLCEGIETTDPAFHSGDHPPDNLVARIWVSVETSYPVRIEGEYVRDNGERRFDFVQDQFQWDMELDESIFEPNIPEGYIDISPNEWK